MKGIIKKAQRGFTLIELLIVIALLGALAVGLIGTLDPIEQINRGRDTGIRNLANEVHKAFSRYYTQVGWMPWCASSECTNVLNQPSEQPLGGPYFVEAKGNLRRSGELKDNFDELNSADNQNQLYITGNNNGGVVSVCMEPRSKGLRADPNTRYNRAGEVTTGGQFWCVR